MALASLVPFQGPKKSQFSGPTPSNAPCNDVAPLKTITYRAIKTTGTLIVIPAFTVTVQSHLVRLLAIWKQMVNGAHRYVSGLLQYLLWQQRNEQILSLFATAQ
jgi:hypothetical protein